MADQMKTILVIEDIDENLKDFYCATWFTAAHTIGKPDLFLYYFNFVREKTSNDPNKIKLYLENTRNFKSQKEFLFLIYSYTNLKERIEGKDDKFFSDLPNSFVKDWHQFEDKFKDELLRYGNSIINDYVEKIDKVLKKEFKESEWDNVLFASDLKGMIFKGTKKITNNLGPIYDLISRELEIEGGMLRSGNFNWDDPHADYDLWSYYKDAQEALILIEKKILKKNLDEVISRWNQIPTLKISNQIKNKKALYGIFEEIITSYTIGNNLTVTVLCRSAMEHVLFNYYGGKKMVNQNPRLDEMIGNACENFHSLNENMLHKERKAMNTAIHAFKGEQINDKRALHHIYFVKNLIENVPYK